MRRTTTRRAASAGLGALAATTALALAAPSASAATTTVLLDPPSDATFASVLALPTDEELLADLFEEGGALPLPEGPEGPDDPDGGEVVLALPEGVSPLQAGEVEASFLSPEDAFALDFGEEPEGEPLLTETEGELTAAVDGDVVTVGFAPGALDDDDEEALEDGVGVLVLGGLGLDALPDLPLSVSVPLSATPDEIYTGPLELQGISVVGGFLPDTVSVEAGSALELVVSEGSLLDSLGLDLTTAQISLFDLEGFDAAEDADAEADAPEAPGTGVQQLRALADAADAAEEDLPGLVDLDVAVADDGTSASATVPAGTAAGDYALDVSLFDAPFEAVEQGDFSELGLVASISADVEITAPAAPTPTVTQTVTVAPPQQNPGLRSNTGVEDAAPGLSDGGLVLLGSGLLAAAGVTGAAVARSSRRARG